MTSRDEVYDAQIGNAKAELQRMVDAQDWTTLCPEKPETCDGLVPVQAFMLRCPLSRTVCPHIASRAAFAREQYRANTQIPIDARYPEFDRVPEDVSDGVRLYCETIPERVRAGEGLLLLGDVGVGKTCALSLIALAAAAAYVERMVYIHMADLFGLLHRGDDTDYYFRADLLLLDDLGVEYSEPWALAEWHRLIEHRHGERLSTCVTSNMSAEQMSNSPNMRRVFDRLRERNACLVTNAENQRRRMTVEDWREAEAAND